MASAPQADGRDRIGKYEILGKLSEGGMAEVLLAVLTGPRGFKKFVTLKRILPDLQQLDEFVSLFLDEARLTAALSHGNIAQVFDLGDADGELYIAMEFIAGEELGNVSWASAQQGKLLPVGFVAKVVREVCLALHYAHTFTDALGEPIMVVHRDLTPANVMVTYAGGVKVIDFGIAKAKGMLERTSAGHVRGSVGYMSPEQIRAEKLDGRSDLFALGVVMHELLTGQRLFKKDTPVETMETILEVDAPPVTAINPRVPKALAAVVSRALMRVRDRRFVSGLEMARAIERATDDMFDEAQVASLMRELFTERIAATRNLLKLAESPAGDEGQLRQAAHALEPQKAASEPGPATRRLGQQPAEPRPSANPEESTHITHIANLKNLDEGSSSDGATQVVKLPLENESTRVVPAPATPKEKSPPRPPTSVTAAAPAPAVNKRPAAGPPDRVTTGATPKVLVIIESMDEQNVFETQLGRAGYDVMICGSGQEALEVLPKFRPTLVLLDGELESMDALALTRTLKSGVLKNVPLALVSSEASLPAVHRAQAAGASDVIEKPFGGAELLARVKALLKK